MPWTYRKTSLRSVKAKRFTSAAWKISVTWRWVATTSGSDTTTPSTIFQGIGVGGARPSSVTSPSVSSRGFFRCAMRASIFRSSQETSLVISIRAVPKATEFERPMPYVKRPPSVVSGRRSVTYSMSISVVCNEPERRPNGSNCPSVYRTGAGMSDRPPAHPASASITPSTKPAHATRDRWVSPTIAEPLRE